MHRLASSATRLLAVLASVLAGAGALAPTPSGAAARPRVRVENIRFDSDGSKGVLLIADSCRELREHVAAIREWTAKLPGEKLAKEPEGCPFDKARNRYVLDITGSLPSWVTRVQGTAPQCDGPNCWNTSLMSTGLLEALPRYSTPEEMSFWMHSPLCRRVPAAEAPKPGDLIAIRRVPPFTTGIIQPAQEVHGFVYLTDELSFSKNGADRASPFNLQSSKEVYRGYGVSPGCERVDEPAPEACRTYAVHHRCMSVDEYLKIGSSRASEKLSGELKALRKVECLISEWALNGHPAVDRTQLQLVDSTLALIARQAVAELARPGLSDDEKLAWRSLASRTEALKIQMQQFR